MSRRLLSLLSGQSSVNLTLLRSAALCTSICL
jgi:hypothetical protein